MVPPPQTAVAGCTGRRVDVPPTALTRTRTVVGWHGCPGCSTSPPPSGMSTLRSAVAVVLPPGHRVTAEAARDGSQGLTSVGSGLPLLSSSSRLGRPATVHACDEVF